MKNTEFAVGSKIRVIDNSSGYYKFRGTIIEANLDINGKDIGDKYYCRLHDLNNIKTDKVWLNSAQICNIQKKFIDIEHIRETDIDLGNGIIRKGNTGAFSVGDIIQITEKVDGSNASISYNKEDDVLEVFSRTNLLNGIDGLRGFKSYIDTHLKKDDFNTVSNFVIFGEWTVSHHVQYNNKEWNTWKVYDIWDKNIKNYMPQIFVKEFCKLHNLEYIHVLYEGPFISWEHCRSFLHSNTYGESQEGIVIKNQSKLINDEIRAPKYLKIVNDEFKESMISKKNKEKKEIPLEIQKEMDEARNLMASVVTEARVRKFIMKMVDDGKLQSELKPSDMNKICKELPKGIFADLCKEEPEILKKAGSYAGKYSASIAIDIARKIIVGN